MAHAGAGRNVKSFEGGSEMASDKLSKEKVPPDKLPDEYDKRVFIGGNYDNIKILRDIQEAVHQLGLGLTAILPRDDVEVPLQDTHDWDLRILHNCRYAIFDVSVPGGELMEIERVREYGTQTLLLYQSRDEGPPSHITRMLRTCKLPLKGYYRDVDLKNTIREFLAPMAPLDAIMQPYLRIVGYCFEELTAFEEIQKGGLGTDVVQFKGLRATGDKPVSLIEDHVWEVTSGEILDRVGFRLIEGDPMRVSWAQTYKDAKCVEGKVVIEPPLTKRDEGISYELTMRTRGAYCLTKEEFKHTYPDDPSIVESYERKIIHPVVSLMMGVKFYNGYAFNPTIAILYGNYQDVDAAAAPMVSFRRPSPTEALLSVNWPKPGHRYVISWEPADEP